MTRGDRVLVLDRNGSGRWRQAWLSKEAPYQHRSCKTPGWYISWADLSDADYQNGASAGGWKPESDIRPLAEATA